MLTDRKNHIRVISMITALSLIMMFVMPFTEIMRVEAEGEDYFTAVVTDPPGDGVDFGGKVNTIKINGNEYTNDSGNIVDAGNGNNYQFSMALSYEYDKDQLNNSGILTSKTIYYQVPQDIKIDKDYYGAGEYVNDNKYSDTLPSGYYSISKNGLIVIRFTDAYISYLTQRGGLKGDIAFNGMVERDQTPSGDKTVNVANKEITFEFADEQLSINKSGSTGLDASGKQCINWNITINNPNGHFNLSDYSIKDTITDNDGPFDWTKVTDVTVDPAGAATRSGDGFTLSGNAHQVNISYKTPAENLHTYKNDAIIKKGDEEIVSDSEKISIKNQLEVNKSGVADYTYSGKEGKKAKWTIELKNKSGGTLNNTKITDDTIDFPADTKVYYFDSSNQRVELDSSKYSIDGKEITFTDPTLPSRLVVEYEANITGNYDTSGQIQVDNGVKAESTEPNGPVSDPENGYKTATVYYQHQYKIDKSCTRFNTEDDMLQWKIDVNAGMASLDGYEITDSGFVGKTYNNNEREGDYISFNAWDNNNNEIDAKVKLVKENPQSNKIKIQLQDGQDVKIAKMEIYYNQPIQDNLSSDDLSKYRNGDNVTVRNRADGTMPGTGIAEYGIGEKEGRKRREASKHYHSTANEQVIGNADQANRTLDWSVTLTNDNGFGNNDVYTDTLKSDNGGKHYITSDQAAAFSLKSGTTPIPATAYTITFYDENNNVINFPDENKKAVKFTIQFNDSINSSYHSLSLDYKTTAEVSGVENGNTAHFNNGYDYGTTKDKTTDGLTFVREDPTNVKTIKINVRKTWNDRNNKFNTRPDDYTVEIWRAKVDSNGDCPVANDPDAWEIVNTYNLTKDQDQLTGDFPQWVVETDDGGIQSVVRYCYKIVETNIKNGYTNTNTSPPIIADHDANFELTNKKDLDVIKIAVDKDGKPINSADLSTVPKAKVDINGTPTDCYIFGWEIFFKEGDDDYTDTLPEGAVYLPTSSDPKLSKYNPYPWGKDEYTGGPSWSNWEDWALAATADGNTLHIKVKDPSQVVSFRYYTAIPKDKIEDALDPDRKLINTVEDDADHKEYTGTLNVNGDAPDDTQHLKKGANKTLTAGEVVYSLDVNPTGKKMSNEDYINITDALEIGANSSRKTGLKFVLDRINVYPYDENGQVDKDHPIEDYSYTVDYDYSEEKAIAVTESSEIMKDGAYVTVYSINGWDVGDSITLIAERNPECDTQSPGEIYMFNENFNINSPDWNNNLTKQQVQFPQYSNDQSKIEKCVIPENTKYIFVLAKHTMEHVWNPETNQNDIYHKNRMKSLDATAYSKTVPAYLNIDVPDQQHLYVEYKYIVKGFQNGDNITLTNTASFEEDNGSGWDKVEGYQLNLDGSNASSGTNTNPKIYKVDINNYSLNTLEASFKVAKWDKENERWIYASAIQDVGSDIRKLVFPTDADGYLETVSDGKHYAPANAAVLKFAKTDDPSTQSNDTVHEFKLEDKALYKFVEIESPQNYRQVDASGSLEDNSEFVFYYAYNGYTGSTPPDAMAADGKSKIRNISAGNNINIPNSQFISIKAQKSFTGTGDDIPDSAVVSLGLYYSTSRNGKNLKMVTADMVNGNSFDNPTTPLTYNKSGNDPVYEWTGLPSGINGSPVYYFVREESCTYDGTTYTRDLADDKLKNGTDECPFQPVYTRNGTNKNGTVIEVNNSEGIAVKKIWQKSDGSSYTGTADIDYEVYGIKGSTREIYYSDKLTLANGYQQILPSSYDGKNLSDYDTFEVEEITKLGEGWTTSTTRKLENGTGTLEIINTQEVEDTTTNISVKKEWNMNGSTQTHPDSVTVKLIQSLDSIAPGNVTESNGVATPDFGNCIAVAEQTLNDSNHWEFTWNDLPKKNADDHTYYYYVIETSDYPGYTVSYSLNNQGTLTTITNTFKKVDLKVNKLWAGDDNKDHSGETIKFVIKRSTNPDDVPNNGTTVGDEQEIFVPEKTVTVIASPSEVYEGATINLSATFGNDDVTGSAVFYVDGNQIEGHTFTPTSNEVGDHTIKATYHGKVSEVTVTVKEKQLTIDPETETIYEGHSITFASEYGDAPVDAVYTVNSTDAVVNGNKITFNAPGTYTVTATYNNDKHATANITVNAMPLLITPTESTINQNESITFTAQYDSKTVNATYTVSENNTDVTNDSSKVEISDNVIKFKDEGKYTVTATYNGKTAEAEITVNPNPATLTTTISATNTIASGTENGPYFVYDLSSLSNYTITKIEVMLKNINSTNGVVAYNSHYAQNNFGWNDGQASLANGLVTLVINSNNPPDNLGVKSYSGSISTDNVESITITYKNPNYIQPSFALPDLLKETLLSKGQTFGTYQAAAPTLTSARSKRPLRGGNITKTVGAEALENEVTELFFNTNVSDIIELGAGKTPSTKMNVSIVGGKVKLKANKQGAGDTDSEWTKTINGLPATDENNQPYYYWIEEVDVDPNYSASYTGNNVDAVNTGGNAAITITNTKKNDTGVELPISGGSGLNTIYTIGAVLLMMSGAGYTMYRRRRWYDE